MKRFICRECEEPCIVSVSNVACPPEFCVCSTGDKKDCVQWEEIKDPPMKESDTFEMHGFDESLLKDDGERHAATQGTKKDPKSRYYDVGGIEVLDVIRAKLTPDQYKGWLLGNMIKYSCRANHKCQFDRDVEKIKFYVTELFDSLDV